MLRVGTVFSGIGAIEHALERMGVPHELVFACDNSGIDWREKLPNAKALGRFIEALAARTSNTGLFQCEECQRTMSNASPVSELDAFLPAGYVELSESEQKKASKSAKKSYDSLKNHVLECQHCKVQHINSSASSGTAPIGDSPRPHGKPPLDEVIEAGILGIDDPSIRKKMADDLYKLRPKQQPVRSSYLANYGLHEEHFHTDVSFLQGGAYSGKVDLFVGGSPCQSFSFVGPQGGFEDARGTLFYEFVRLVDEIQPKVFIWENVRGVYTHDGGATWDVIARCFDNLGYTWHHQVLDAKQYGIPQHRQRVFVVGFLNQDPPAGQPLSTKHRLFSLARRFAGFNTVARPRPTLEINRRESNSSSRFGPPRMGKKRVKRLNPKKGLLGCIGQRKKRGGPRTVGADFQFPPPVELRHTMQDFLEDAVAGKYFLGTKGVRFVTRASNHKKQYTQIDGDIMLCQKANQQFNWHGDFVFVDENDGSHRVDEKYFLSQKVEAYVMASGTKGFSAKPEIDLDVARPLLASLHKNHRAGVDNYVTTEGRIRQLTPRECLRLMGFCDSFQQVVSDIQMYKQAGNSIVVDVLIALMAEIIPSMAPRNAVFEGLRERAARVRALFEDLQVQQIREEDLRKVVAALST